MKILSTSLRTLFSLFSKKKTLWLILSTTGQFLEFVSQLDQSILTHFSMVLILRTSSLSLRLEIIRNGKILGGRERREDGYLGLWEVYSEISEEWQTAIKKLTGLEKSPNEKIWSRYHGSKGKEIWNMKIWNCYQEMTSEMKSCPVATIMSS